MGATRAPTLSLPTPRPCHYSLYKPSGVQGAG